MSASSPYKRNQRRVLLVAALLLLLYSAWLRWGGERPRVTGPQPVERVQIPSTLGGAASSRPALPSAGDAGGGGR
ncbi:MAG: hypothetical protein HY342_09065 [Candidatus Lambdaproteobacteria bacterium]|nr:hypothetical protein [Candidatus Lambdaproteobacteria bacterium]